MGWSLAQFFALSYAEQAFWRSWDMRRERQMDDLVQSMREVQSFDKLAALMTVLVERAR